MAAKLRITTADFEWHYFKEDGKNGSREAARCRFGGSRGKRG